MNILVTGGAGYLGSVLVGKLLQYGYKVVVIDNLMYNQLSLLQYCNNPNFKFVWGDVRNIDLVNTYIDRCDFFLPLASIVGAPSCSRDPMSSTVDKAIMKYNLQYKKIIYPMSNSGYGTKTREIYCTEESPLEPISDYGKTKVEVENFLFENCENVITLRFATVFGISHRMRWDLLINYTIFKGVMDRVICVPKDITTNMRNYLHILDATDCFLYCIQNFDKMGGKTFNVGNDDENKSVLELSELIAGVIGCELVITDHYHDQDRRDYIVSNQRLREAGFEANMGIKKEIPKLIQAAQMCKMLNYGRTQFKNA